VLCSDEESPALHVLRLLAEVHPDSLSPREALQLLYQLKDAAHGREPG